MQNTKTVVITGGNSGIGKQTAITFAKNGFTVFITSRNDETGKAATDEIRSLSGNKHVQYIVGNLSTIQACKDLAKNIAARAPALDVLINNAGITALEKKINADGLELSFMVNALAPYLLTKGLVGSLTKSGNPKVLNVSTGKLFLKMAKFDLEKSPYGLDFSKGATYANTKLAGAMLTLNLAEELKSQNIMLNSFSPGVYKTKNSMQDMSNFFLNLVRNIIMWKGMPLTIAGETPYFLATNKALDKVTGSYFDMQKKSKFPPNVTDLQGRAKLSDKTKEWQKE